MCSIQANKPVKRKNWTTWFFAILITGGVAAAIVEFVLPKLWPNNRPPQARISVSTTEGIVSETLVFGGESSSDPEGRPLDYVWRLDGDLVLEAPSLKHQFTEPGEYCVTLTVKDPKGLENTASVIVNISPFQARSIFEALKYYKYEFGWSGNPIGSLDTRIEYHPITDVSFESDTFAVLKYSYRNGVLRMAMSKKRLSGTWSDGDVEQLSDQTRGELELTFVDDSYSQAVGWWNYGGQRQKYNAFMRRVK